MDDETKGTVEESPKEGMFRFRLHDEYGDFMGYQELRIVPQIGSHLWFSIGDRQLYKVTDVTFVVDEYQNYGHLTLKLVPPK